MPPVLSLPSFTGNRNNIDIFLYNWRALLDGINVGKLFLPGGRYIVWSHTAREFLLWWDCSCLLLLLFHQPTFHIMTCSSVWFVAYAVVMCLSACLSVTRWYCIKTAELGMTQITPHDCPCRDSSFLTLSSTCQFVSPNPLCVNLCPQRLYIS